MVTRRLRTRFHPYRSRRDDRKYRVRFCSQRRLLIDSARPQAIGTNIFDNKRYVRKLIAGGGVPLAPEERLPLCCIAGVILPVGLFAFAWTSQPHIHWIASMVFTSLFGFSMVAMFLTTMVRLRTLYFGQPAALLFCLRAAVL